MKNKMQDIVPPNKRSIRHIAVDRVKRPKNNASSIESVQSVKQPPSTPTLEDGGRNGREKGTPNIWLWTIAVVAVFGFLFISLSLLFSGARVIVVPRQVDVRLDAQFTAVQNADFGELAFERMVIEKIGSRIVRAAGEERLDQKASGKIIIFNNFNSSTQRLIKNTRFEASDGLIYRITESVDVPGRTTDEDGEIVPGSVEVTVFADSPGEEYNIDLTDFTIPGFKGDPRFFKFYARSKTPMTGGFSGTVQTVTPADLKSTKTAIESELRGELLQEAHSVTPDGFVLYDDAVFVTFKDLPNAETDNEDSVEVREQATLSGLIFEEVALAQYIAENTIADYDGGEVRIPELADLILVISERSTIDPASVETFNFTLTGNAQVVWVYDAERLKDDLVGKIKKGTDMVFSAYPAIESAEVIVRPFWRRTLPEKVKKIRIEEILE